MQGRASFLPLVPLVLGACASAPDAGDTAIAPSAEGRSQTVSVGGYEYATLPEGVDARAVPPPSFARYQGYFPNTPLITHEGKKVRFFDDLVKGKIVLINFMYTNCDGI